MENLNAEQIIKALECCKTPLASDCEACEYTGKCLENGEYMGCVNLLVADALALIKELTEENEAWQKQLLSQKEKAGKAYYELACEVEDLRAKNENLHASCTELTRNLHECKADAVREMREWLQERVKGIYLDEGELFEILNEYEKQISEDS